MSSSQVKKTAFVAVLVIVSLAILKVFSNLVFTSLIQRTDSLGTFSFGIGLLITYFLLFYFLLKEKVSAFLFAIIFGMFLLWGFALLHNDSGISVSDDIRPLMTITAIALGAAWIWLRITVSERLQKIAKKGRVFSRLVKFELFLSFCFFSEVGWLLSSFHLPGFFNQTMASALKFAPIIWLGFAVSIPMVIALFQKKKQKFSKANMVDVSLTALLCSGFCVMGLFFSSIFFAI